MLFYYGDFVFSRTVQYLSFFDPAGDMRVPAFGRGVFFGTDRPHGLWGISLLNNQG